MQRIGTWPSVVLSGEAQQIPRACPNCLKAPSLEHRTGFANPLTWWFTRTTYYQTFYYCADCGPLVERYVKLRSRIGCLLVPMVMATFIGCIIAGIWIGEQLGLEKRSPVSTWIGIGAIVVGIPLAFMIYDALVRGWAARAKLKEGQVVAGPAAFYVGEGFFATKNKEYRVFRPEWLKLLVEANAAQVDDATYRRITGAAKPAAPEVGGKPFAG